MNYSIKGENIVVTQLKCFDLGLSVMCGQAFRWSETEQGQYEAVVKNKLVKIKQKDDELIFYNTTEDDFLNVYVDYFDLNTDYTQICDVLRADESLKKAIDKYYGIRILKQDDWEALCSFIISQNNNIPRIRKIVASLCENFGERISDTHYTFPSAQKLSQLTVEDLSIIKAGFRAKYILDAAQKVSSNEVRLNEIYDMSLEDGRIELIKIKGLQYA